MPHRPERPRPYSRTFRSAIREQRGDLCHASCQGGEALAHLPDVLVDPPALLGEALAHLPALLKLSFTQGVQGLGVGTQLGADLGYILVSASGQRASGGTVGAGQDELFAELGDVALDDGQAGLDVVGGRHCQIVL